MKTRTYTCRDCGKHGEHCGARGCVRVRCDACKAASRLKWPNGRTDELKCKRCGQAFIQKGRRGRVASFCSSRCRDAGRIHRPVESTCTHCGCGVVGQSRRKYCDACLPMFKPPAERFSCTSCGTQFTKKGGRTKLMFCSRKCSGLAKTKNATLERELRKAAGPACNGRDQLFRIMRRAVRVFSGIYKSIAKNECTSKTICTTCGCVIMCRPHLVRRRRYCCKACIPKKKGTKNHAIRAKRRGLPRVYSITLRAVCDRDGNTCQLCGRQTLIMHVDGNGASPSIDHVVPLGHPMNHVHGHVWNNVQLACRECNEKKNARLEHDSLLFASNPRECVAAIRQRQGRMYARRGRSKKQKEMFD